MKPLTLYELNTLVRETLEDGLPGTYWVQGELSEARAGYGGHFYGELVERCEDTRKGRAQGGELLAKARVTCWQNTYVHVAEKFAHATGESLRKGMMVLLEVSVNFHELYGFSLAIQDIDPSYTLGDMARRRQEILRQLESDGILHDNQALTMPVLPRRVAVVSSASAAGYGDFCDQLLHNEYGYAFSVRLFPAVMQGMRVEESVIGALQQIADEADWWDVVVIIRGGGATSDLSDFDSYPLAACIAQMPLPVITGIGHERDETVLDYVAHTHLKTPTAVAAFLIQRMEEAQAYLESLAQRMADSVRRRLGDEQQRLVHLAAILPLAFRGVRERQEHRLELLFQRMVTASRERNNGERHRLELMEQRLQGLDPDRLLRRGYSMTLVNGRLVTNLDTLSEGQELVTRTYQGEITSTIISWKKRN